MADPCVLTLVRHGETSANLDGVWHGSTDTPLTDRGRAQAERVGGYIRDHCADAVAIYSSPLQRAHHTARSISQAVGLEIALDASLVEFDLGAWEGKTYRELFETHKLWDHMKSDPHFAPHGGESPRGVTDRFCQALAGIAARHPSERAIVVAHGGVLSMVFAELLDGDYSQWRRVMNNCAVSELILEPTPRLLSFNHTDHLEGL